MRCVCTSSDNNDVSEKTTQLNDAVGDYTIDA
jgi:hypothetical protein